MPQSKELGAIAAALGLPPEATIEDCVAAINGLKGNMQAATEQKAAFEKVNGRIAELEKKNAQLEHEARVTNYQKVTAGFTALAGKPEEIAAELVGIEEKAGKETADRVLASYSKANDAAQAATKAVGTDKRGGQGEKHAFEKKVDERAAAKKISFQKAMVELAGEDPKGFAEYNEAQKGQ